MLAGSLSRPRQLPLLATTSCLALIVACLCALLTATNALPTRVPLAVPDGDMIIDFDPSQPVDDALVQRVVAILMRNGMPEAKNRIHRLEIGDSDEQQVQALAVPDMGDSVRAQLRAELEGRIRAIEGQVTWGSAQEPPVPVPSPPPPASPVPAGIDRIDSRTGLDQQFRYFPTSKLGAATDIYVIDSGCDDKHPDLAGRVVFKQDLTGEGDEDQNGHGTHTAATAAGKLHGIARNANIICLKVLDRNSKTTQITVLRALDVVSEQIKKRRAPAVVNMSLYANPPPSSSSSYYATFADRFRSLYQGWPKGQWSVESTTERAIDALVAEGVSVVMSAGNNNGKDACDYSPGFVKSALTVGATNPRNDSVAPFSNVGSPGVQIESARANTTATRPLSGTSMSAPHVAGVLSVLLGEGLTRVAAERVCWTWLCAT
ncbi:peptidase S8/S53 domain-containing protein [Catenaria anguillulae PL171]|uniref:Peptidase S8/S53 domain-containing protein n=1 Tax=Catenaria anguillulae PL171 TaxID=765915 RepID=A0A1Y2HUV0_9FUNG|nr:peptidase S8/S53 domain-containing protein [Catenaria anguillulae PL171]